MSVWDMESFRNPDCFLLCCDSPSVINQVGEKMKVRDFLNYMTSFSPQ